MSKINLQDGSDLVLLTHNSDYYIYPADVTVGTVFNLHGLTITPIVEEVESDGAQKITIDPTVYVTDDKGTRYVAIVGGRPQTRVRR